MKKFYICFLIFIASSCSSSKKEIKESLDYSEDDKIAIENKKSEIIKWEDFFSSSVDLEEKEYIRSKLQKKTAEKKSSNLLQDGFLYLKLGDIQSAEDLFQQAIRQDTSSKEAHLGLAIISVKNSNFKLAFNLLAKIKNDMAASSISDDVFVFKYRYILAIAYQYYGDHFQARKILADLIKKNKDFLPGYAALASSYLKDNKLKLAKFIVQRGLDQGKDTADLLSLMGCIYYLENMPEKSRSYFTKALEKESAHIPSLINQSVVYIDAGEYNEANKNLNKALNLEPSRADIYIVYGALKALQKKFADADILLKKAVEINPNSPEARFNLSLASLEQGVNPSFAIRLLSEVKQLTETTSELNQTAGELISEIHLNRDLMP